jgi:hypothetical protein
MDGLRFSYLVECVDHLRRHTDDFRDAAKDGRAAEARIHFEAIAAVGKSMRDTLQEIEISQKQPAKEAA